MNISDFLSLRAAQNPNAVAAVDALASLTFGELDRIAWQLASRLIRSGVLPGARIGLSFTRQLPQLAVSLAVIRIGAVQIALPPSSGTTELKSICARAAISLILSNHADAARLGLPVEMCRLPELLADTSEIDLSSRHETGDAPFMLIPGSGTTGKSKLIPILSSAYPDLLARDNAARPIAFGEKHFSASSINYYTSLRRALNCVGAGAICVFKDGFEDIVNSCTSFAVDHLSIVPIHAQKLLDSLGPQPEPVLPGLKSIVIGGSPVSETLRHQLRQRINPNLIVVYGANELGETTFAPPAMQDAHPGCVGTPCGDMQIEIVDESDTPLPCGTVGLVRLKTPGMFPAYLDDDASTAKALRHGWYYPGDLGSLTPDNVLIFQGRADDIMMYNSINIYPREIERILEMHPAVIEAAAFPIPSEENYQIPAAAVATRDKVDERELLALCREHLGNRMPRSVLILESLPRNASGKIMKRDLAARFSLRAR
jgi:cyanophycin synthetase